jgi:ureidoacrylate peracid hydrolase
MGRIFDHPALVVVDMQEGFVSPDGAYGQLGRRLKGVDRVTEAIRELLEEFRRRELPRFFTAYRYRSDGSDFPGRREGLLPRAYAGRTDPVFTPSSPATRILPSLGPWPGETVVWKNRYSAFLGTSFESQLRSAGVKTLVLSGVVSHVCVSATAMDAFSREFSVVLVRDALAGLDEKVHEATLLNLEDVVGPVLDRSEVLSRLPEPSGVSEPASGKSG